MSTILQPRRPARAARPAGGRAAASPALRLLSSGEFLAMAEAGIIRQDERVELIEGVIYRMSPIGPRHSSVVKKLQWLLEQHDRGAERYIVFTQSTSEVAPHSAPQPDLMLVRTRADFYFESLPVPEDIFLVVEVADSTIAHDRKVKGPLYAKAGIAEFWLVDVAGRAVEVHRKPSAKGYRSVERVTRRGSVSPLAFPDAVVALKDLFPPA